MKTTNEAKIELNTEACLRLALEVYRKWESAMTPPIYIYVPFKKWCEDHLEKELKAKKGEGK